MIENLSELHQDYKAALEKLEQFKMSKRPLFLDP